MCHGPRVKLFGKRTAAASDASVAHPVTEFWDWWRSEGHRIDPRTVSPAARRLEQLVQAIHPELTWHFGPGRDAQHRLTVSAGGVAAVRSAAERWLRAAPGADATWEFRSSQEAEPEVLSNTLEIAGERLALAETSLRCEVAEDELRVHVGIHHPAFTRMPEQARLQVCFLLLDWLLGEDDVERWVGHVEALAGPGADSAEDLRIAVVRLESLRDPDSYSLATFERDGRPGLASFRRGLRWLDHPVLDRHHALHVAYAARADELPAAPEELTRLQQAEDELTSVLAGRGVLVAHETHRGRRTFHVYTDSEDQNADVAVQRWAADAGAEIEVSSDPGWSEVRRFTG